MSCETIENVLSTLEAIDMNTLKNKKKVSEILIKNIPDAIDEIYVLSKKSELKCYSNKIKLCSSQLAKVLPSFVKILTTRTDPAFKEITHYLAEKLHWCFNEVLRITKGGGLEDDSEPSGLFMKSVDNIAEFFLKSDPHDTKLNMLIEDLLCHALTIAKVAAVEDYQEIAAACKNILSCTSGVLTIADIEKEPLKKDSILCSIAVLERKVNIAVLRLYLNVSSKFLPPLKSIIKKSGISCSDSSKSRQPSDIQNEVNILDEYFERVQLIGNYAVACTDCKNKKLKVQCCLTSLEFLANYIIPAATSFYCDPNNLIKKRFLQYLTDESLDELKALVCHLDYNIVDTAAFVQVIHEDIVGVILTLKEKVNYGSYNVLDSNELVSKCYKLVNHLKVTDDPLVKGNQNVTKTAKQLLNALKDHGEQSRDPKTILDKERFYAKLDCIVVYIELLLEELNKEYLDFLENTSQSNTDNSDQCSKAKGRNFLRFSSYPQKDISENPILLENQVNAVSSTPFSINLRKTINHSSCLLVKNPSTPKNNIDSLDPYLKKIGETPLLRSAVRIKTPYREVYLKRTLPNHPLFSRPDSEDNASTPLS
ncbi:uncharacterized protein [Halyomorpha halys]|uniref:uncharacterized protein isoform X2 n=1 Tax=Halyomorpha halys TaxID=286706 RepID=UPI000D0C87B6|nr:uncharacterized protein LOC106677293 isoform X2 [Halyomorpha halys]